MVSFAAALNKWALSSETLSFGIPTRSDTDRTGQLQKMVRGLKFRILVVE